MAKAYMQESDTLINDNGFMPGIPDRAKRVFEGITYDQWQWEQELYNGTKATFERLVRPDSAMLIPIQENGAIILIEDEQPGRTTVLTPPGGIVEKDETAQQAAERETREETGYTVESSTAWFSYAPAARIDHLVHVFVGYGAQTTASPNPEAGERITVKKYTFEKFLQLGINHQIRDRMLRIMLLEALLESKKKTILRHLFYGANS